MASGSFELSVSGYMQAKITWSSSSNGSSANSSAVYADIYVRRTNGYTTRGHSWRMYLNIGGSTTSKSYYDDSVSVSSDWVWMGSHSATIGHNNDGTGSVYISGEIQGPSGTAAADWVSTGGQWCTLDTIPRASDINGFNANSSYLDTDMSVDFTPKATFNHWLRIDAGGSRIKNINMGSQTAGWKRYSFNLRDVLSTIYNWIGGSNDHITIKIWIDTYNGNDWIGATSSLSKTMYMPASIKPSVTGVTISEAITRNSRKIWSICSIKI